MNILSGISAKRKYDSNSYLISLYHHHFRRYVFYQSIKRLKEDLSVREEEEKKREEVKEKNIDGEEVKDRDGDKEVSGPSG